MSSSVIFKDRNEAGRMLAKELEGIDRENTIVLALPRGGVITAKEVADALGLPLDIIVTRKIGAPENDEYAIGAIDINGDGIWNETERAAVDKKWLSRKIDKEKEEALRRWSLYRGSRPPLDLRDKTAIIIDDGIATGLTMKAAIQYAEKIGAKKIIVAAPVAASDSVAELRKNTDVHALEIPQFFFAVGEWYEDFGQIEDDEVTRILAEHQNR